MTLLTATRKLTNCKVNTLANTATDSSIDRRASRATKGEVDNGGVAAAKSVVHSSVDSTDDVGKGAAPFVGQYFDGEDRGLRGRPETTRQRC
jgi:hypothetical protein